MNIIQNKIIITLLIIIASAVTYFVVSDIAEKKAIKEAEEKRKIEIERSDKKLYETHERLKRQHNNKWGGDSRYRKVLGKQDEENL